MEQDLKEQVIHTASHRAWEKIGISRKSGVLAPLFSVYSEKSLGIGEYPDIKLLVDFCVRTGNRILQLLPMNETGPVSCPYDSISSFALEPVYLRLEALRDADISGLSRDIVLLKDDFPCKTTHVDYRLKAQKLALLRRIFQNSSLEHLRPFEDFVKEQRYWLDDFCLFCTLKSLHGQKAWYDWEAAYRDRAGCHSLDLIRQDHRQEMLFFAWLQWQAYEQFKDAKSYAQSQGVLIKGDLPILVSRDSADVWAHPGYFKLGFDAGAPADMYCAKGQRWGTPTYDWERIFADGGTYVKEKLHYARSFYDILRIDHVVGLFRIWSIPVNEPQENMGLHGFFDPRDEHGWGYHGKRILSLLVESTDMLLCAEDLGVIPPVCTRTLREYGIPGNDVQRWSKDWVRRHDFLPPQEYRLLGVSMLSTHDTTNWPAWWEHEAGTIDEALFIRKCNQRAIAYPQVRDKLFDAARSRHGRLRWHERIESADTLVSILGRSRDELLDFIDLYENSYREKEKLWQLLKQEEPMREQSAGALVNAVLRQNLASQAVFCINLIFDLLYLEDAPGRDPYENRINTPGTVSARNWSLRLGLTLEQLLEHPVCQRIKTMVRDAGR